jgi:hypothetical protein
VFKRVRRESPASYLKVCAMLVPKEVKLEHSTSAIKELTDEELEQAIHPSDAGGPGRKDKGHRSDRRTYSIAGADRGQATPAQAVQSIA